MAKERVSLTFPEDLIKEPIVWKLGHQFKVITNIREAFVTEKIGRVGLEIEGEIDEIEKAIAWLKETGVRVDPIEGDVFEG